MQSITSILTKVFVLLVGVGCLALPLSAQDTENTDTEDTASEDTASGYALEDFATGLEKPWSLAFLPTGDILLSELSGNLRRINPEGKVSAPINGVPEVDFSGQGGLSDVILDPEFFFNNTIYISYSARDPKQGNALTLFVARGTLRGNNLRDVETIFIAKAPRRAPVHYGAKMVFMRDGTLIIASGDGFDHREEAQELDNHFGKLIRINTDGTVPADNPFVDQAGAEPEIWSYGHRNMQALLVTDDGTLYENEHGPRGGDELNVIKKGANYGWPAICHCLDYSFAVITPFTEAEGMEQPLKYWRPSIAPSGMTYYDGSGFPEWIGSFFVTGLVPGDVRRLTPNEDGSYNEEVLFTELKARLRNIYQTPEGFLMILAEGPDDEIPDGKLIVVKPSS